VVTRPDDDLGAIAGALLDAEASATTLAPFSDTRPDFDAAAAYAVLQRITEARVAAGWHPVGRKIGFTNTTIWELFGVDRPMWAPIWDRTVRDAPGGVATAALASFVQPRIEPEVVVGLSGPVPLTDDPVAILGAVEWLAAGFEVVQCPFPGWRFALPDCTAAFGLHAALVVGERVPVAAADRERLAATLPTFEVLLRRDGEEVDRGVGANVLGSPVLALAHLAEVLAEQPAAPPLAAGEVVTTGTITGAWPIAPGETWTSGYGDLGLPGLTLTLT
jgi:2-oxo-3-hexenedioate decarboxylase